MHQQSQDTLERVMQRFGLEFQVTTRVFLNGSFVIFVFKENVICFRS